MGIVALPHGIEGKSLSRAELRRYFDAPSLDALLLDLRRYRRKGFFDYAVMLSSDYFTWERARYDLKLHTDVLMPFDPFGALAKSPYGIRVKADTPLADDEIIEVVTKLPSDLADKYMQFEFSEINKDRLRDFVKAPAAAIDHYVEQLDHQGLTIHGADVSYLGASIAMGYQQRELLRVFLERPGQLIAPDELIDNPDIFSKDRVLNDAHTTLSKLVSAVRRKLQIVIEKPCIVNEPNEGWRLIL